MERCLCGVVPSALVTCEEVHCDKNWYICIYFGKGGINQFPDDSVRNTQWFAKIAKIIAVWKDAFAVPCVSVTQRAWPTPPKVDLNSSNFFVKYAGILMIFKDWDWYWFQIRSQITLRYHNAPPHLRCVKSMMEQRNDCDRCGMGWGRMHREWFALGDNFQRIARLHLIKLILRTQCLKI